MEGVLLTLEKLALNSVRWILEVRSWAGFRNDDTETWIFWGKDLKLVNSFQFASLNKNAISSIYLQNDRLST